MQQQQQQQQVPIVHPEFRTDAKFMRCTVGKLPYSGNLTTQTRLPIGIVCQPMALDTTEQAPLDVVNFGTTGIIRCKKCRAYVNPYVNWLNNGRQWRCNVCGFVNDVPNAYFCQLDQETGQRRDVEQRPELRKGSVELVAPGEYMVRPPQPPVYVFLIDVSPNAVASGLVSVVAQTILEQLDNLPGSERTMFALLTFDSSVHFYSLKSSLNQPQMVCVSDLQDLFVPLPDDLLVNLAESRQIIETLLEGLPSMHAATPRPGGGPPSLAVGPALVAAYRVMGHIGGKLCVFVSGLPSAGEAALADRESGRNFAEHHLLKPAESLGPNKEKEVSWYETKAVEFSRLQIGVELFVAASASYVDIASMGILPKITAGQLYYYPQFHASKDGKKLSEELARSLSRPTGFEAVMRFRCTRGLRVSAFRGNYYIRGHDLLALPNCSPDSVFALELAHDEQPLNVPFASVQASLLYTTSYGERRIRVHTMIVPITQSAQEVVSSVDVDALVNVLAKGAVETGIKGGLDSVRGKLQSKCVEIVSASRSASSGGGGMYRGGPPAPQQQQTLKLPESLQLLPLYTMALLKSSAFRGSNDVSADERSFVLQTLDNMSPDQTRYYVYPRLLSISSVQGDTTQLNLSSESIDSGGIFLLDNSTKFFVWIGANAPQDLVDHFFYQTPEGEVKLKDDTALTALLDDDLRKTRPPYLEVDVLKEGDPHKQPVFFRHLVEDAANFPGGQFSYQEFMHHLHSRA